LQAIFKRNFKEDAEKLLPAASFFFIIPAKRESLPGGGVALSGKMCSRTISTLRYFPASRLALEQAFSFGGSLFVKCNYYGRTK